MCGVSKLAGHFVSDITVWRGDSGGGIFDRNGKCLGIAIEAVEPIFQYDSEDDERNETKGSSYEQNKKEERRNDRGVCV